MGVAVAEKIVWFLAKANITISSHLGQPPGLNGITQGTGVHLNRRTITQNNTNFIQSGIDDTDNDLEDNDASQTLLQDVPLNGVVYPAGARV